MNKTFSQIILFILLTHTIFAMDLMDLSLGELAKNLAQIRAEHTANAAKSTGANSKNSLCSGTHAK